MDSQIYIQYVIEFFVILLSGIILLRIQTRRPNLVSYLTNISNFIVPGQPPLQIGTHSITIQNMGRGKAEGIEVCHNQLPLFNIFPDIQYEVEPTPQGGKIIKFNDLLPKSKLIISYLYVNAENPTQYLPTYVKSKEATARVISIIHTPVYPKWTKCLAGILMMLGSIFLLNVIVEGIKLMLRSI